MSNPERVKQTLTRLLLELEQAHSTITLLTFNAPANSEEGVYYKESRAKLADVRTKLKRLHKVKHA